LNQTLLSVTFRLVVLMLAALLAPLVGADTSVWEQMQEGHTSQVRAKIKSLEINSGSVRVGFVTKVNGKDSPALEYTRMCDDFATEGIPNGYIDSESRRAALASQRMELLRDAFKSGETVELAYKGPWNPCLQSVRLVKN
jgi:hypothetical protein